MSAEATAASAIRRGPFFLLLLCIFLFHLSGYVGNEMATTTFSATLAIVEQGTPIIDDYTAGAQELAYYRGHFYSGMPPGQTFLAVPLYFVLRPAIAPVAHVVSPRLQSLPAARRYELQNEFVVRRMILLILFTVLVAIPCAAATCVLTVDLARHLRVPVGLSGALLLPLCTIWWAYGTEYGPRVLAAFALMLPVWWVVTRRDEASPRARWGMAAVIGAGLAFAPMFRYELVFAVVVVGLWAAWRLRGREAAVMVMAGLVIGGLGAAYHARCYGSPTATAYSRKIWVADGIEAMTGRSPEDLPRVMYEGREHVIWDQSKWLGVNWRNIPVALWASPEALLRFSPFLLTVPWGLWLLVRKRGPAREVAALPTGFFVADLVAIVLLPNPGFIGTVGPRYLLWTIPALVLLALPAWSRLPRRLRALLFAASFAPSYLAAMLTSHTANAWSFGQLAHYGLTNYTLSRMQEAGVFHSPLISTAIVLAFWALIALVFLRPGSRWSVRAPVAEQPREVAP